LDNSDIWIESGVYESKNSYNSQQVQWVNYGRCEQGTLERSNSAESTLYIESSTQTKHSSLQPNGIEIDGNFIILF